MAAVVRMPALAAGATEAAIQTWLVDVGDAVTAGQAIVEIETEKAVVEYEAEASGTLAGILVDAGASAAVGAPIAVLAADGEDPDAAMDAAGAEAKPSAGSGPEPDTSAGDAGTGPEPATSAEDAGTGPEPATSAEDAGSGPEPATSAAARPEASAAQTDTDGAATSPRRLFASPLVRRLARERGIDLSTVRGSGPQGRIVRRDLDDHADVAPSPATAPATASAPAAPSAAFTDVPHTGMRRAIARRLTESTTTVPHFFVTADCRVDELLAVRARINEGAEVKISVNDFVLKAVAWAMRDVPDANAIWTDDATRRFESVDVGVAVAVPSGLLTPVVRGVERMTLGEISAAVRDLADRAKAGRLKQHELEGGSFAVSNLGMYGTREFSAIINPPHAGILAVGAAAPRPVVDDEGDLAVATVMTVTLSADHRVLDGAVAAQWLAAFVRRIENPLGMLV